MKHYTTIEQSKKLLELGLNPESADCCWRVLPGVKDGMPDQYIALAIDKTYFETDIPCWSLGALLEVMPCRSVISSRRGFIGDEKLYFCNCVFNDAEPINYDTPIKAAYSMVAYLLEKGIVSSVLKR